MCCHSVAVPVPSTVSFCVPRRPTVSRLITPQVLSQRTHRVGGVVLRAEPAGFFARERGEQRSCAAAARRPRWTRASSSITATPLALSSAPGCTLPSSPLCTSGQPSAEVIVVRAEHGALVLERVVRARQDRRSRWPPRAAGRLRPFGTVKRWKYVPLVAAGLQPVRPEPVRDVLGRLVESRAAEAAPLKLGRREERHVVAHRLLREHGRQVRQRLAAVRRQRRERAAALALGPQIDAQRRVRLLPLALDDVGRLVAFEAEIRVLPVVGELAAEAGEGRRGLRRRSSRRPSPRWPGGGDEAPACGRRAASSRRRCRRPRRPRAARGALRTRPGPGGWSARQSTRRGRLAGPSARCRGPP